MIRVVHVRGFENDSIVPSMLSLEDRIVFLVRKNMQNEEMHFDKIVKYHVLSNEFAEWSFTKPVGIVSNHDSGKHVMYYASTEWKNHEVNIEFYNFDCDTFKNTFVCSINMEDKSGSHIGDSDITNTELYGIDERFCIVALPNVSDDSNASIFSQVLLLDSAEKRLYQIPNILGNNDLFCRLDQLYIQKYNGETCLYLKTGRCTVSEKRRAYRVRNKNSLDKSLDGNESIICIEINKFISMVKREIPIGIDSILDSCKSESAFSMMNANGRIFYGRYNFAHNNTEIMEIASGQIHRKHTVKGVENRVVQSDGRYFLMNEHEGKQVLLDLESEKTIFITSPDERIITGNLKYVITNRFRTSEIFYYNLLENSSNKIGTGLTDFDPSKNELILFHE
ncbi:hypothetical protein ACFSO0_09090 [Brevibacillus sp. GCM10020057]|uniref:hypothetical protein n=1 Tax=Brevibacillus sp. GCM10020057 TaxID=3317327 RepID=UPI00363AC7A4